MDGDNSGTSVHFQSHIALKLFATMLARSSTGSAVYMKGQVIESGEGFSAVRTFVPQFILSQAFKMSITLVTFHSITNIASSKFISAFRTLQVRFQVIGHRGQVLEQRTNRHS